jgi:hypothetical protein
MRTKEELLSLYRKLYHGARSPFVKDILKRKGIALKELIETKKNELPKEKTSGQLSKQELQEIFS